MQQDGAYGAAPQRRDGFKVIGGGLPLGTRRLRLTSASKYGDDALHPYVGALLDREFNHRLYASFTIFRLGRAGHQFRPARSDHRQVLRNRAEERLLQRAAADLDHVRIEQDNLAVLIGTATPPGELPQNVYRPADDTVGEGFDQVAGELAPGLNVFGFSHFTIKARTISEIVTKAKPQSGEVLYDLPAGALSDLTIGGGVNYRSSAYSPGQQPDLGRGYLRKQRGSSCAGQPDGAL